MQRATIPTSSETSANPGGSQNPSGFCEGFGMPELESAKREGLHGRKQKSDFDLISCQCFLKLIWEGSTFLGSRIRDVCEDGINHE